MDSRGVEWGQEEANKTQKQTKKPPRTFQHEQLKKDPLNHQIFSASLSQFF